MAEKKPEAGKLPTVRTGLASKRGLPLPSGRLQSFRSPRDLTLSSTKRTYSPTIPVRRIKEEPKDGPSKQPAPKKEGGQTRERGRGRGRRRGRGHGRGQPDIIESKSIFSEGPMAKLNIGAGPSRPSYGGGGFGGGGGGGGGGESKPGAIKLEKNFETGNPDKILKMLHEDGEMDMDEDQLECGVLPIQLPLAYHDRIKEEEEEITCLPKSEPMETDEKKPFIKPASMPAQGRILEEQKMTCQRLLTSSDMTKKEQLLFFQFPDSLPTKMFEEDQKDSNSKEAAKESLNLRDISEGYIGKLQAAKKSLNLRDISEGYIGKLQVHKSGRTRLILGSVALDVSMGTPCNFLQDLVSIHTEEENKSVLTLGHVKERVVCTPDFEELLKNKKV